MKSYEYKEQLRLKKRKTKLPDVSLIIVDSRSGRIFDFKDDNLNYKKEIISSFPGRVKSGGWSQMKIERHIKVHLFWHFKKIEKETNHDVKAVEYYIKAELSKLNVQQSIHELVHFCCTSEDINNLSWGLIVKDSLNLEFNPKLNNLVDILVKIAQDNSSVPMMARTHGQPATPTTVGKEIANFAYRVSQLSSKLKKIKVKGKFNGAVGMIINYNLLTKH